MNVYGMTKEEEKQSRRFEIGYCKDKKINEFLRGCDLFNAGEGLTTEEIITIRWKKGEKLNKKRIKDTCKNIKLAFEKAGAEVFYVRALDN